MSDHRIGPVMTLVIRAFDEFSDDLDTLIRDIARGHARKQFQNMGFKTAKAAFSTCLMWTRDRIIHEFTRAQTWLILDRIDQLHPGSKQAQERRKQASYRFLATQAAYVEYSKRRGRSQFFPPR